MDSFDRMIQLLKKTGDRCIILDAQGEPAYVIISFAHYHALLDREKKFRSESRGTNRGNSVAPTLFALADELQALKEAMRQGGLAPLEASSARNAPKGPPGGGLPLTGLTEGQLLDKINRDIAVWKERQKAQNQSFHEWDTMMEQVHPTGEQEENNDEDTYEPEPLE